MMTVVEMPLQIGADGSPCISIGIQQYFRHYDMKPVIDITYNPIGQTIINRSNNNFLKGGHKTEKEYAITST